MKPFNLFMSVCYVHFSEHLFQIYQLYILHWDRKDCLGMIGLLLPALMRSQWLHFGYAVFMWIGIYVFMPLLGLTAFILQTLHTFEHYLMVFYGFCIGERWFPRIELHFYYNLIVLAPMLYHRATRSKLL